MDLYIYTGKEKRIAYLLISIGILTLLLGLFDSSVSGARFWGNILVEALFYLFISIGATFFMSLQYAAQAGWSVVVKRVSEALAMFMPFGILIIFIVIISSVFGGLHGSADIVYRWMQKGITDPGSPNYDELFAKKTNYLNIPFFILRTLLIGGAWIYMTMKMRKRSIESDLRPDFLSLHFKNVITAGIFIVFFGITEQCLAWDWVMSIDYDWHSTLYGWYLFDDMWLTGVISIVLLTLFLRHKGLLQDVNENHLHNLGIWTFALSVLWGYLWFWQFMLYWYTNIPDEVVYFQVRIDHYRWMFWLMFVINLCLPLIALVSRDSKRNKNFLIVIGSILIVTHWADVFLYVTPGIIGRSWHFGIYEIGMALGFLGLFLHVVLSSLAKAPVLVKNHPYLEESIHHHI